LTDTLTDVVILGSGLSGGNAAKTLREEGYDKRLVLLGDEPGVPFGRPPLSKTYMRGEEALDGWLVEPPDWYPKHDVEFLRTTATRIDTAERRLELRSGGVVGYSKLLIATGGRNRRLKVPGADLPGVHQLRTVGECDAIKEMAAPGRRAVVVGMGFIGSEVAASLRQLGVSISAVLPEDAPLESVLGPEMGEVMVGIHVDHGVELITHDEVIRFEGTDHVERAITKGGRTIECDFAIVAIGIKPNVEVLAGTGVAVENGVLVDATCRTNVPDIFAAGDVANHLHPLFGRVRVEHYNNAEKQGAAAARSILGPPVDYDYLYSFWSDQYEHKLEYVGHVRNWDDFIIRGSLKDRKLVGFYLVDGMLKAAVGFDRGGDPELDTDGEMAKAGRLIARRARPEPAALADEDQDLALL
jgi:3-phenylpropionate/trans-cinnamate dioxygenase ferredoxin reductase subunit